VGVGVVEGERDGGRGTRSRGAAEKREIERAMGNYSYGPGDGFYLAVAILVPLGFWKAVEITVWVFSHLRWQ
jgi:hypothetical protein